MIPYNSVQQMDNVFDSTKTMMLRTISPQVAIPTKSSNSAGLTVSLLYQAHSNIAAKAIKLYHNSSTQNDVKSVKFY